MNKMVEEKEKRQIEVTQKESHSLKNVSEFIRVRYEFFQLSCKKSDVQFKVEFSLRILYMSYRDDE